MTAISSSIAVIGAGNGGIAMGAYMASTGAKVRLYDKFAETVNPIATAGGVYLNGPGVKQFVRLSAGTNLEHTLDGAGLVMIVTPANAHAEVARAIAPYLANGSIIVLNPGRTGGALEVRRVLSEYRAVSDIVIAETQTLLFAARKLSATSVRVTGIKRQVPVAALPGLATAKTVELLNHFFPQFVTAQNILETSLANIGAIFHPAPTILNAARIETTLGEFDYYHEGISPAVADILEKLDFERVLVARAAGVATPSAQQWLSQVYGASGSTLYEAIKNNNAYQGIRAPKTVNVRYIFEDVPTGLVPISSFGQAFGCPTPLIDSIINLAVAMSGINYWRTGRNVDTLGIAGLSPADIIRKTNIQ